MPRPSSYTSLSTVQRCERQYSYRYVHRLKAEQRESAPMVLGSWWHALRAVDAIQRGTEHGSLLLCPDVLTTSDSGPSLVVSLDRATFKVSGMERVPSVTEGALPLTVASLLAVAEGWWEASLSEESREAFEEKAGDALPSLLGNLWSRHLDRWGADIAKERPLIVEGEWERTVPGSEVVLRGAIDEVLLDTARGIVVVRDHKSHGSWPAQSDATLDLMDAQIHLYAWGASSLLADTEYSVQAVEYDRARTKVPATPSMTKTGNLSKSTTDFDLWTYLRWIESGEASYERYKKDVSAEELDALPEGEDWKTIAEVTVTEPDPAVIEALSADDVQDAFFRRHRRPVNVGVIKTHLRDAAASAARAEQVRQTVADDGYVPRSSGRACEWCDYALLCRAEMFGEVDPETDPATFGLRNLPTA